MDIVLDSGADASALPLAWSGVGEYAGAAKVAAGFVDAQGNSLHVQTVRTAEVGLGDAVFPENFIVSPVTSPLICLGHLYPAGYYVLPDKGSGLILTDGVTKIPMGYRNQSFVVKGSIRAVSKEDSQYHSTRFASEAKGTARYMVRHRIRCCGVQVHVYMWIRL